MAITGDFLTTKVWQKSMAITGDFLTTEELQQDNKTTLSSFPLHNDNHKNKQEITKKVFKSNRLLHLSHSI